MGKVVVVDILSHSAAPLRWNIIALFLFAAALQNQFVVIRNSSGLFLEAEVMSA